MTVEWDNTTKMHQMATRRTTSGWAHMPSLILLERPNTPTGTSVTRKVMSPGDMRPLYREPKKGHYSGRGMSESHALRYHRDGPLARDPRQVLGYSQSMGLDRGPLLRYRLPGENRRTLGHNQILHCAPARSPWEFRVSRLSS